MIYFDNSATTLKKPAAVSEAVAYAINNFGNAGRSFHSAVLTANREIYNTRAQAAKLIGLDDPLCVAFTSSATESLNLVAGGLCEQGAGVITTVMEHNSVLRPLYLKGCDLSFIDCDNNGNLRVEMFEKLLKPQTKFLFCTHGSNVTGNITDAAALYDICKTHNITMVLDISQTFGCTDVNINMADIFCFTGHKSLFGPQGTGGIITNGEFDFNITKTGGAGTHSFEKTQSKQMPDVFEAGTINSHSLYGLQKGISFIIDTGIENIRTKQTRLMKLFYDGIKDLKNIKIYGDFSHENRLPIVSLNVADLTSSELSEKLWTEYKIATRPGSHCAPLLHERLGTAQLGIVRFSFSYFNTEEEIKAGIAAIGAIAAVAK